MVVVVLEFASRKWNKASALCVNSSWKLVTIMHSTASVSFFTVGSESDQDGISGNGSLAVGVSPDWISSSNVIGCQSADSTVESHNTNALNSVQFACEKHKCFNLSKKKEMENLPAIKLLLVVDLQRKSKPPPWFPAGNAPAGMLPLRPAAQRT